MRERKSGKRSTEKKRRKLWWLYIVIPLALVLGIVAGVYYYVNGKIYVPSGDKIFETKEEEQQAKYDEEKGIINILLIGLDGRVSQEDSRTDSIILATLDTSNKQIKMTSFMRDMYVPIPGHKDNRINTAFFLGGPELLIKTINQDFDLNVQYYVSIDFKAFQALVEKLGGVNVEVKDYEIEQINYYINEVNGSKSTYIKSAGFQDLNGQQALSYCRIRKVGNSDFERTERQRRVLGELIKKTKKTSILKLPDLFNTILPFIKTNIPTNRLMNMGYTVLKFGSLSVDSIRVPGNGMFDATSIYGMSVLVPDLEKNMDYLNDFIFSTGGSTIANMPVYMANNFHAKDKAVDNRKKERYVPQIVIPKPDPDQDPPDGVIVDVDNGIVIPPEYSDYTEDTSSGSNTGDGTNQNGDNSGNTSGDNSGESSGGEADGSGSTDQGNTNTDGNGQTTPVDNNSNGGTNTSPPADNSGNNTTQGGN